MTAIYLASLIFGGLLMGVALFFGGDASDMDADLDLELDVDMDADFDVDADADGGLDMDSVQDMLEAGGQGTNDAMWLPFLSLRFWVFGLTAFGATGLLLSLLITTMIALPLAIATGMISGTGAAWFFKRLKSETVSADTTLKRFVGNEARVLLPIRPGSRGRIVIDSMGGHIELTARTGDDHAIERGQMVLIAAIEDGVADVTGFRGPDGMPAKARQRLPQ